MPAHTPTTVPATARGRLVRDRILNATASLIRERGVAGVTLDDVEQAAGVGRSQLYHYFGGREELIRAVVDRTVDSVLGGSADYLADLDSVDGVARWFAYVETLCAQRDGAGGCPIGSLVGQLAERDDALRAALVDAFGRWEAPLVVGLTRMQERGELGEEVDVEALADFVMAALQGGLLLAQVRRDAGQLQRALDGALSVLRARAINRGLRRTLPEEAPVGGTTEAAEFD